MAGIKSKVLMKPIPLTTSNTAAIRTFTVDAPDDFKTVRGFYIIRNSGSDLLKIGVKDSAGNQILEPVNATHLTVSNTVPIKDKFFKETPFRAEGTKFIVTVENFATPAVTQDTDFVFIVDNEPHN